MCENTTCPCYNKEFYYNCSSWWVEGNITKCNKAKNIITEFVDYFENYGYNDLLPNYLK